MFSTLLFHKSDSLLTMKTAPNSWRCSMPKPDASQLRAFRPSI